jgi:hypothetical protein
MKSMAEILGGAQILLGLVYDIQDSFEEYISGKRPRAANRFEQAAREKAHLLCSRPERTVQGQDYGRTSKLALE